jgi:hypothetical protein
LVITPLGVSISKKKRRKKRESNEKGKSRSFTIRTGVNEASKYYDLMGQSKSSASARPLFPPSHAAVSGPGRGKKGERAEAGDANPSPSPRPRPFALTSLRPRGKAPLLI